jgi:hypothetical protein
MVGTEAVLAVAAVDHLVVELCDVSRCDPGVRVHDDRRVERDDIVAQLDRLTPPRVLHVALEDRTERTVVEETADPAVDLTGLEDEPATLRERGDLLEADVGLRCGLRHRTAEVRGARPRLLTATGARCCAAAA